MLVINEKHKNKIIWLWIFGDWGGHQYFKVFFKWGEIVNYRRWVLWLTFALNALGGAWLTAGYIWLLVQMGDVSTPMMSNFERVFIPFLFYVAMPLSIALPFGKDLLRLLTMLLRKDTNG